MQSVYQGLGRYKHIFKLQGKKVKRLVHVGSLVNDPICRAAKETQMLRTDFWTHWEKVRVGRFEKIALKHAYYCM